MRRTDPRLGIAVFLGGTALVLMALIAVARYPALFNRGREFRAVFHSVAGLNLGDEVRYGGLLIGSVTAMDLDPTDPTSIIVEFRVKRRTPVRVDTRATITQVGLLGEPYLNLVPGAADAPVLPAGSTLITEETLSFQEAMNRMALFLDRVDTLMTGVEKVASTSPWERIERTLSRVEILVGSASDGSEKVFSQLDKATMQLSTVLTQTERLVAALDTTVQSAGPGLSATQREALATIEETRALVADVRAALQSGNGLDQLMRDMSTTSENLARLSTRIERDPSSVLKRRDPPRKTAGPPAHD